MTRQIIATAMLALALAACVGRPETDPDTPIEVRSGDEFSLVLDSNATTGYEWRLASPLDEGVVTLAGSEYEGPGGLYPAPGAGGQEVWTFTAVAPGSTEIALEYVRPWEEGTPAAETRTFSVVVK